MGGVGGRGVHNTWDKSTSLPGIFRIYSRLRKCLNHSKNNRPRPTPHYMYVQN